MRVFQTNNFKKAVKKLRANQKTELDKAVRTILADPSIGAEKIGDLAGVRVHKFYMLKQLVLLAYKYEVQNSSIVLLALGSHENFYRDLKNIS